MLARFRKAMDEREEGFTLIELLVVMIIIGILAAIAIPVFLSQKDKAKDTSAKADVSVISKSVQSYYVDGASTMAVTQTTGVSWTLTSGDSTPFVDTGKLSPGNTAAGTVTNSTAWCVQVTSAATGSGTHVYSVSYASGLKNNACIGATN